MATAQNISIEAHNVGLWRREKQTEEAAAKVTELLQKDIEVYIDLSPGIYNNRGLTDHDGRNIMCSSMTMVSTIMQVKGPWAQWQLPQVITADTPTKTAHHLLTLFGTGASATHLQKGYDDNTGYQRPLMPAHQRVIEELQSWDHASKYLGHGLYYPDFLAFFQREIADKGWEAVVSEYLFSGTQDAEDLLVRLHGSIIHPLIQLMFGMEWGQPAVVAEALAQTCVHKDELKGELHAADKIANDEYGKAGDEGRKRMPSIVSLLKEAHDQPALAKVDGDNRYWDWVSSGAPDEVIRIMSKVKVWPEELEEKTVEMFNTVMFAAAGAAFHPPKLNKFNFYFM